MSKTSFRRSRILYGINLAYIFTFEILVESHERNFLLIIFCFMSSQVIITFVFFPFLSGYFSFEGSWDV